VFGYHSRCKTFFTNQSKLSAAELNYQKSADEETSTIHDEGDCGTSGVGERSTEEESESARRLVRSKVTSLMKPGLPILKEVCVICEKDVLRYSFRGETRVEKLSKCETISAGLYILFLLNLI
jgi:hypothetical protein